MNDPFLNRVREVYGDPVSAEVEAALLLPCCTQNEVEILAGALMKHQKLPNISVGSDPFPSDPTPLHFVFDKALQQNP